MEPQYTEGLELTNHKWTTDSCNQAVYALCQLVFNGGNDPANRDKWLWGLGREKKCLVGMWLPTLNAIRPPVAGEC